MKIKTRTFGNAGAKVSEVGLGTWMMESDGTAAVKALQKGLEEGANHIDSAEMYGSGRVEQIVAKAIAGRRDKVFLVTKVLPSNASYKGTIEACERSLKNLGTDFLDIYLLHWRGSHPLEETFRAFDKLIEEGKVRSWGVSNFDVSDLEEAIEVVPPGRISCNQVYYHLKERAIEHAVLPWCQERGVAVVAYSPLGQGDFPKAKALDEVARTHKATPAQVALAFLLRHDGMFVIPKSSNADHVVENLGASALKLTEEDIAKLDKAFPKGRPRSLPMI